jgi:hypothetical protein
MNMNWSWKMSKLEELKATAAKLQKQIEELEKPKQWEPRMGAFYPAGCRYPRRTEDDSDKCYSIMRTHNRLLAYVDEFGGGWVADWSDRWQRKFTVLRCHETKQWAKESWGMQETLGTVYMSLDCAEGLVFKLESGEALL